MTPKTRATNKDADYKVYYRKKVPQQARFPHRRKIVRRPSSPAKDASGKRQMKFLSDKLKIKGSFFAQSDEEEREDMDVDTDGGLAIGSGGDSEEPRTAQVAKKRSKKRNSDTMQAVTDDEEDPVRPTPKRRRKAAPPTHARRSTQVEADSEDRASARAEDRRELSRSRILRRQSTMTQLVEGRRPVADAEEPIFQPVKRGSRVSWGRQGSSSKDKKQRTLTQMVHGWESTEIVSDDDVEETLSDVEAKERDSQAYDDMIAARLTQEGLLQSKSNEVERLAVEEATELEHVHVDELHGHSQRAPSFVLQSVEDDVDDHDEDSYAPTQFIDAPRMRARRSPRQLPGQPNQVPQAAVSPVNPGESSVSKFGLLSTPEKRRARVIPSSQSPADSPLPTQPWVRSVLQDRCANTVQGAETPSKRKQITFQVLTTEPRAPPSLRKFKSVIQDSEDSEDDLIDEHAPVQEQQVGAHTQALIRNMDDRIDCRTVGVETQAVLDQIDQACESADGEPTCHDRASSEELSVPIVAHIANDPSPELGLAPTLPPPTRDEATLQEHSLYYAAHSSNKQEHSDNVNVVDFASIGEHQSASTEDEHVPIPEQIPSSPPLVQQPVDDTCPLTPMVIMDDSSDEEDEPAPTPPSTVKRPVPEPYSTALQLSVDLDGEPIQVPRSPSAQYETQKSHSSKAEQKLQNEWLSYTQYAAARPPQSSSMVRHDKFSYHATPLAPRDPTGPHPSAYQLSQATTVDEGTPRKSRTQRTVSTNTTPHKNASSQPFFSPVKPPPLFIPSSFPSPAKARVDEWSSPVLARTQDTYMGHVGGSIEDFSIPPPPPEYD
jgi:hypothetical protein